MSAHVRESPRGARKLCSRMRLKMDDCFEKRLCEEIRRYPHLYNSSLKEYKDSLMVLTSWRAIAQTLGRDENTCRQKWKYLRDRYVKAKRKLKGVSGEGGGSAYIPPIVAMLDWLSGFITHRAPEANLPGEGRLCEQVTASDDSPKLSGLPQSLHNGDEAVAIENAIRAAINTVISVIRSACSRRELEYQRMVAVRDREIRRLECKLEESELKVLRIEEGRRQPEDELSCPATCNAREMNINSSNNDIKREPCETPTQISPKCHDMAEAFPHQHAQPEKPSREREGAAGGQPFGRITSLVKEEPSDLVIKWEVCEGSLLHQQEGQHGAEYQHEEKPAKKGTQAECDSEGKNPQMSKLMATEHEDERAAHLKRKGRERNGCHPPQSEEGEVAVKKACMNQPPAPLITAPKDSVGVISSPQPRRQSVNGTLTSSSDAQDPPACQQQTCVTVSAPQPTCDPILLEVLVSLKTIKQQNTTVLQILQSGNSSGAPLCEPPDVGTLPLPLQSVQDLRSLEQRLSTEPELKKKMARISHLGLCCGMTTKESAWRIMAKLFTNSLAKNINWRGRKNKQKIENLTIKSVILNAVRQNSFCKNAVDEEIERHVKRWLQLAGDRDGGRKRRQDKEANSMED